ncbi:peptide methionine sulfoxide reductase [Zobellia alginiliquefaciens]|uniref:peptide methionine sulfoxide reductase n=1 Tax=Zobellia alginiliquefaciens TaxID=3032586 RepID=UPI0023E09F77|nr:peptide methionine sulfoxide reductase [Zobellia alginiliquefaciens]
MTTLLQRIRKLPVGYCQVVYNEKRYGVTRSDFNNGNSHKVYAEELGGNDFISLNYYVTSTLENLKPCEMPLKKVENFLNGFQFA